MRGDRVESPCPGSRHPRGTFGRGGGLGLTTLTAFLLAGPGIAQDASSEAASASERLLRIADDEDASRDSLLQEGRMLLAVVAGEPELDHDHASDVTALVMFEWRDRNAKSSRFQWRPKRPAGAEERGSSS